MKESEIIELYGARDERAIAETRAAVGPLLRRIAGGILRDNRDAEEAIQDACLAAWDSIPPAEPKSLASYMVKLTRNAAIDRARENSRMKRGAGEYPAVLDELSDLASPSDTEREAVERVAFRGALSEFLAGLPKRSRMVFVKRYWYFMSEREISRDMLMTVSAVKSLLSRLRRQFREVLEKEEIIE